LRDQIAEQRHFAQRRAGRHRVVEPQQRAIEHAGLLRLEVARNEAVLAVDGLAGLAQQQTQLSDRVLDLALPPAALGVLVIHDVEYVNSCIHREQIAGSTGTRGSGDPGAVVEVIDTNHPVALHHGGTQGNYI
jgi:hypothetical protein